MQSTKDDVLIAFHDWSLERVTGVAKRTDSLSFTEMALLNAANAFCGVPLSAADDQNSELDLSDDPSSSHSQLRARFCAAAHRIPSLSEVAALAEELGLLVIFELKPGITSARVAESLRELYDRHPYLLSRSAVMSFYPWLLYEVRRAAPHIPTVLLMNEHLLARACSDPHSSWHAESLLCRVPLAARAVDAVSWAAANTLLPWYLGLGGLAPHVCDITPERVLQWRTLGIAAGEKDALPERENFLYAWGVQVDSPLSCTRGRNDGDGSVRAQAENVAFAEDIVTGLRGLNVSFTPNVLPLP